MSMQSDSTLESERTLFDQVRPLFIALGDTDRQDIVVHLAGCDRLSVADLTSLTNLSRPTVSYHLKVLRDAGLIREEREGAKRFYQPTFSKYIELMRRLVEVAEKLDTGGNYGK